MLKNSYEVKLSISKREKLYAQRRWRFHMLSLLTQSAQQIPLVASDFWLKKEPPKCIWLAIFRLLPKRLDRLSASVLKQVLFHG